MLLDFPSQILDRGCLASASKTRRNTAQIPKGIEGMVDRQRDRDT